MSLRVLRGNWQLNAHNLSRLEKGSGNEVHYFYISQDGIGGKSLRLDKTYLQT